MMYDAIEQRSVTLSSGDTREAGVWDVRDQLICGNVFTIKSESVGSVVGGTKQTTSFSARHLFGYGAVVSKSTSSHPMHFVLFSFVSNEMSLQISLESSIA